MINNDFYNELDEKWYEAKDHPVALLRAENRLRAPWIANEIAARLGKKVAILDVGCGAGFLTNHLQLQGHEVTGVDISESSLEVAKRHDRTQKVRYMQANAYALPFPDQSFDVVCATDILEHVEQPEKLIQEASRVLKKGGLFFFHTFNRTLLSYVVIIKGVEWFVKNAPPSMHVYNLFIRPKELQNMCEKEALFVEKMVGFVPDIATRAFWKMLLFRTVSADFSFRF